MVVRLTYSGHDPEQYVDAPESLVERALEVQKRTGFDIGDCDEGREIVEELEACPKAPKPKVPSFVCYV